MTSAEIIEKFELQVDDMTELSTSEELALLNKVYHLVCNNRAWEFLKKEWSTTTNGLSTISLPSDFAYFVENNGYTQNNDSVSNNCTPKGVFVNNNFFQLVNWSDRKQYASQSNICWVDVGNNNLCFSVAPTSGLSISADYIKVPDNLILSTSPIFPARFHDVIYHGMATQDYIIQQSDKAQSYATENNSLYQSYLDDMAVWNSQLIIL